MWECRVQRVNGNIPAPRWYDLKECLKETKQSYALSLQESEGNDFSESEQPNSSQSFYKESIHDLTDSINKMNLYSPVQLVPLPNTGSTSQNQRTPQFQFSQDRESF